uniref:CKLF like MARVEL transmembrane domain containing 1 n=1 Tax=Sus scrofa TaxID=9823 RepID=A0A4X1UQE8_PIG
GDPEDDDAPSEDWKPRGRPRRPGGMDLINSFITTVFLLVVAALVMREKERRHLFYVGGTLCLTAAIVCLIDATVVTKTMRKNMKKALGIDTEANPPSTSKPNPTAKVPKTGGPNALQGQP